METNLIISIIAVFLSLTSFVFLKNKINKFEKKFKEKVIDSLEKEKLLNDFLNDFHLSIRRFLEDNHFVMCQDQEFLSTNMNYLEKMFEKTFYRISENKKYSNHILNIIQNKIITDSMKQKHQIVSVTKEVHTKKDLHHGMRDLIIKFSHGLFDINIELKRNDPHIKVDEQRNSIITCRNYSKDRLRILADFQEMSISQLNNQDSDTEQIYLFMYFETYGNNGIYHYADLKDLSGFAYSSKEHREERIYNNFTIHELEENLNKFLGSEQNEIFEMKYLDEFNSKDMIINQNVYNFKKRLTNFDFSVVEKNKSTLGVFAPCEVEFKSILIGRNLQ
jgi:hypothetical protein